MTWYKKFKILSRETLIDSIYCPIEKQRVELPDGSETDWFINKISDAVIIVPEKSNGEVLLIEIYKHGAGEPVLEFPAGMIDNNEDPLVAAARELEEETGLVAGELVYLGSHYSNPTGSSMRYHFVWAKDCEALRDQHLEPAEQIRFVWEGSIDQAFDTLRDSGRSSAGCLGAKVWF